MNILNVVKAIFKSGFITLFLAMSVNVSAAGEFAQDVQMTASFLAKGECNRADTWFEFNSRRMVGCFDFHFDRDMRQLDGRLQLHIQCIAEECSASNGWDLGLFTHDEGTGMYLYNHKMRKEFDGRLYMYYVKQCIWTDGAYDCRRVSNIVEITHLNAGPIIHE